MLKFLLQYPLYIPFVIINIWIIYKLVKEVLNKDNDKDDPNDGGIPANNDDPDLDLPPGVSLPKEPEVTTH